MPLEDVADIYTASGPNTINRENVRRRIIVQCNVAGRGLVDVVERHSGAARADRSEAADRATSSSTAASSRASSRPRGRSRVLFVASLVGMFLVLYTLFRSVNLSLQVMAALPMAVIGAVAALVVTGQTLTVAAWSASSRWSASRRATASCCSNHYLHLVKYEGEGWTQEMIVRGGKERLAPVLMTALTAGIALVPLVLAAGEPGKEILYPVATVILGGLISSTLLDFFVHPALFWTLRPRLGPPRR